MKLRMIQTIHCYPQNNKYILSNIKKHNIKNAFHEIK